MKDKDIVEEFERSWKYTRQMTNAFISCVPEDKWTFSHHPRFAPLQKQFAHIVKVYGCYVDALNSRTLNMSKKADFKLKSESRDEIEMTLKNIDLSLSEILSKLKEFGLEQLSVNVFGMKMGFTEFTHVMIQHEVSHFGLWMNYAVFGNFPTPKMWQEEWKL